MPKIICTVPEAAFSKSEITALEASLRDAYAEQFGDSESIMVLWYRLPPGQSYVAGSEDDVYIALVEVADGLDQVLREAAMLHFTKVFAESAGVSFGKPLVSMLDSSKVSEYLQANRERLRWSSRLRFLLGTLLHAVSSRRRDGFSSIKVNL